MLRIRKIENCPREKKKKKKNYNNKKTNKKIVR